MKRSMFFWLFKLKYFVALAIFVVAIGFIGESSIVNRISQKGEISRLKGEIGIQERKFESDGRELDALKHDTEAVKEVARSRYYMKMDNEDVFIVEYGE